MKNILLTIIPLALLLMVKPLSTNILKTPLLEKNIVLRTETHIKNSTRFFGSDLPFYMIISINDKSPSLNNRWKSPPFLLIKGNNEKEKKLLTITL